MSQQLEFNCQNYYLIIFSLVLFNLAIYDVKVKGFVQLPRIYRQFKFRARCAASIITVYDKTRRYFFLQKLPLNTSIYLRCYVCQAVCPQLLVSLSLTKFIYVNRQCLVDLIWAIKNPILSKRLLGWDGHKLLEQLEPLFGNTVPFLTFGNYNFGSWFNFWVFVALNSRCFESSLLPC